MHNCVAPSVRCIWDFRATDYRAAVQSLNDYVVTTITGSKLAKATIRRETIALVRFVCPLAT